MPGICRYIIQSQLSVIEKAKEHLHGDAEILIELTAMEYGINALLKLVGRYETLARIMGRQNIADVLARVPMHGARTLREAF